MQVILYKRAGTSKYCKYQKIIIFYNNNFENSRNVKICILTSSANKKVCNSDKVKNKVSCEA